MKKGVGKILLPIAVCFLMGEALGSAPEPVRLFVKEVPLKVLGKTLSVIAIEQADGTQGYSPEKVDGFHVEVPIMPVNSKHDDQISVAGSRINARKPADRPENASVAP